MDASDEAGDEVDISEGTQMSGSAEEAAAQEPVAEAPAPAAAEAEAGAGDGVSALVVALSEIALEVSIEEPRQMGSGMSKYFAFPVSTKLEQMVACFKLTEFGVDRRFSHFEALYNHLVKEFPGSIVPLLPAKGTVGVNYSVNMSARRLGLEIFLRRVCADKDLSTSAFLISFLEAAEAPSAADSKALAPAGAAPAAASGGWGMSFLSKATAKPKAIEFSEDDVAMQKEGAASDELEAKLKVLRAAAATLAGRQGEHGAATEKFGAALAALSEIEGDAELSKVIASAGESAVAAAEIDATLAEQIEERLGKPAGELARSCQEVKLALQRRVEARTALGLAMADMDTKVAALAKAEEAKSKIAEGARTEKIEARVTAAAAAEEGAKATLKAAKEAFKSITTKLQANLERHHAEQTAQKMGVIRSLIEAQIEANKAAASRWEELAAEIGDEV